MDTWQTGPLTLFVASGYMANWVTNTAATPTLTAILDCAQTTTTDTTRSLSTWQTGSLTQQVDIETMLTVLLDFGHNTQLLSDAHMDTMIMLTLTRQIPGATRLIVYNL